MKHQLHRWCAAVLLACATSASLSYAQELRNEGVLGNSGESGSTLVRFGAKKSYRDAGGMGVVYDRMGTLWDRAGAGVLNRYALDGRWLGSYRIPADIASSDHIALVGDRIVLLLREQLHVLDITQAPASTGMSSRDLKRPLKMISTNHHHGKLAAVDPQFQIVWVDPATGQVEPITALPSKNVRSIDVMPDGAIAFFMDGQINKIVNGQIVKDERWPRRIHGDRESSPEGLQYLDGNWFAHAWHSTIKRYDADFSPAPGVVLGGASGWVIGHVPSNEEIGMAQGMAKINDRLYAASGIGNVLHLLEWDASEGKMKLARRIGALPDVPGLAIDPQGRISTGLGYWEWSDDARTPMSDAAGPELMGQLAMLDNGCLATPASRYGGSRPTWLSGPTTDDRRTDDRTDFQPGGQPAVGAVAVKFEGRQLVYLINSKGEGLIIQVGARGNYERQAGGFKVQAPMGVTRWTTLALQDAQTLLAAGDGQVHRFRLIKAGVEEAGLWQPAESDSSANFGKSIHIAADSGRLWVADTLRHRVVCFDAATGQKLGHFGVTDKAGDDLRSLSKPTTIAARGNRAVVFDSANQRLIRLSLP